MEFQNLRDFKGFKCYTGLCTTTWYAVNSTTWQGIRELLLPVREINWHLRPQAFV